MANAKAGRAGDIDEARAAEFALSEARLRAILEAALDAVVSIDDRARVTYVNSAFEHIFGYQAADVIGRELADVIVPPSLREAHRDGFARYLATREPRVLDRRIEVAAMRADGTEFPAEVTITRTGVPGELAFTGYLRDITERQRAHQELMASRARLVAASDAARQRVTRDLHDGAQQRLVTHRDQPPAGRAEVGLGAAARAGTARPRAHRRPAGNRASCARSWPGSTPRSSPSAAWPRRSARSTARLPLPVEVDVPDRRLPVSVEASVYFFCAEALTNVVKHARAARAWVRLAVADGRCDVEVRDDGVGGARLGRQSSGLAGLVDRIGALRRDRRHRQPGRGRDGAAGLRSRFRVVEP